MQIRLASVMVDDQEKALNFYSTVLGFAKKADITMGSFRWLTVSSPEGVAGVELLEPDGLPAGQNLPEGTFRCWHPRLSVFLPLMFKPNICA